MKKNLAFLLVLLTVSAARSDQNDNLQKKGIISSTTQGEIMPMAMGPHLVHVTSAPGGAMVYISDLGMDCLPLTYEYHTTAGGTQMSSGEGKSRQGSFFVECPTPNFTVHFSGSCAAGHSFFGNASVGQAVPNCGLEFTEMSLSSAGGYATLIFTPSTTKMNPVRYAVFQNGIQQSEGDINPQGGTVRIPFGTTTSNIEVRIYGDKCMCANKTDHYYSQTF